MILETRRSAGYAQSASIILLHPMYHPENVLPAVELLVGQLQEQGYKFCTVEELPGS
jgi:peptidoglycan/xylan/chitin deacetylase (PgdA/CDA1 family)